MSIYEGYNVRKLNIDEFEQFQKIVMRAYPVMLPDNFSEEARQGWLERMKKSSEDSQSTRTYCGVFDADRLLGGMIYFDYTMTVFSQHLPVGGVGLICVDLMYKKQHVAKAKNVVWFGYSHNQGCLQQAVPTLRKYNLRLTIISDTMRVMLRRLEDEKLFNFVQYNALYAELA